MLDWDRLVANIATYDMAPVHVRGTVNGTARLVDVLLEDRDISLVFQVGASQFKARVSKAELLDAAAATSGTDQPAEHRLADHIAVFTEEELNGRVIPEDRVVRLDFDF